MLEFIKVGLGHLSAPRAMTGQGEFDSTKLLIDLTEGHGALGDAHEHQRLGHICKAPMLCQAEEEIEIIAGPVHFSLHLFAAWVRNIIVELQNVTRPESRPASTR